MFSILLTLVGWAFALGLTVVALWSWGRLLHAPKRHDGDRNWRLGMTNYWTTPLLFSTAAVAAYTSLGVLGVLAGSLIAGGLLLLTAGVYREWTWFGNEEHRVNDLPGIRAHVTGGIQGTIHDARRAAEWLRRDKPAHVPVLAAAVAAPSPATTTAVAPPALPDRPQGVPVPPKASKIAPDRRARRAAARQGGTLPAEWGPVITSTADFHPEDDGELLDWMTRQIIGLAGWAEALVEFYDEATNGIGIDPRASAMLHDVADAAAQCSETMGGAKARFIEHYELPREYAGNGGLMTHDGRWVTGEDGA